MGKATGRSRGFTLIATLLLLALMSAIAVGLIYTVTGAGHVGGNDMEANTAYYGAESGMEKLTSDLGTLYLKKLSPTQADLDTMAAGSAPSAAEINGMTFRETAKWSQTNPDGTPKTETTVIASGQNQGLTALIIPITLQVSAMRPSGASVNMTRGVQVALVPVFQFGVFSDSDLSYFPGPRFAFAGRVHTNGNLFLAGDSGPLILGSKVTAVGEIIRDRLANNWNSGGYRGSVYVSNAAGGCDSAIAGGAPGANCLDLGPDSNYGTNDASWSGGIPPAGAANPNWAGGTQVSTGRFNGMIGNAKSTGVQPLMLPFVNGAAPCPAGLPGTCNSRQQIEILRPPAGESPTSPLGASREYNRAEIHVLLADTRAELHPDGSPQDADDIQLANYSVTSVSGTGAGSTSFFAVGDPATGDPALVPPICDAGIPVDSRNCPAGGKWPLVQGWLRVEYLDQVTGKFVGVTREWLQYGFAKSPYVTRTAPGVDAGAHPNAILIFQELADRDASGTVTNGAVSYQPPATCGKRGNSACPAVAEGTESLSVTGANSNFYPINFYDVRQGATRDTNDGVCYVNGIMNAVELDVGNLAKWLAGTGAYAGGSGTKVDYLSQNGYLLYFSDRRGLLPDPNATNVVNGTSGWEDVVNSASPTGKPDGFIEPATPGYNDNIGYSPEDVDENGILDNWGAKNMGDGFDIAPVNPPNPYQPVLCTINPAGLPAVAGGRQNWVSGAHHVLRLVDGSLGNLPVRPDNGKGGFTVVAENPVYVWGNYNSNPQGGVPVPDPFWGNPNANGNPGSHSEAAIIADSITFLSNSWSDLNDWENPTTQGARPATQTYYRMAIAAGKNMNFPQTSVKDFGTDGGLHNFLRYLENWGGVNSNYRGSLISLYYSTYDTSIFKCCTTVYNPPNRNYFFDTDFLTPTNLPPGTPTLLDINNLTYWQSFSPCTTQVNGSCTN